MPLILNTAHLLVDAHPSILVIDLVAVLRSDIDVAVGEGGGHLGGPALE